MVKILGHPASTCTQRITTLLAELGVDYELEVIDLFKGAQKDPEYKKQQPFGKIPVLVDGDVTIFESRSICRYLAKKYVDEKNLIGEGVKGAALVDNWLEAESQNYNPPVSAIVYEKVFKPMFGGKTDEAVVAKQLETLEGVLDAYEAVLSDGRDYIAGSDFSVADISHIPYGAMLVKSGVTEPFEKRPHVQAWWERITARDSWKKIQESLAQ